VQSTTNGGKALDRAFPFLWWVIKRKKEKVCIFNAKYLKGMLIFIVADI
jgi:hypothetical protein